MEDTTTIPRNMSHFNIRYRTLGCKEGGKDFGEEIPCVIIATVPIDLLTEERTLHNWKAVHSENIGQLR